MLMRSGLSYRQAADNCNRLARKAYDAAIAAGASIEQAEAAARKAYDAEMAWYES
jgi:hypothetical protein